LIMDIGILCSKCGDRKPHCEFYKGAGRCKECVRRMVRSYRATNIDRVREYDRQRAKTPVRRAHARRVLREWRRRNPDKAKRYRAENPEKYAAHTAVGNAIRDGLLLKPLTCQTCNRGGRIEAHHDDYSRPLDVRWLCPVCHDKADIERRTTA
jgi:hypothetical protein